VRLGIGRVGPDQGPSNLAVVARMTNAIIVAAAVSRQMFPEGPHRANERNLALTTGVGNLLAAPFGGYLMCQGAGGIASHVRFGARAATAPVLIGGMFLGLGLLPR
jgi:SulP family sulfate permease